MAAESRRHQASHALLLQLREKCWELLQLLGGGSGSRPACSQEPPSEEGQGKARALSASVSCRMGLWQKETSPQGSHPPGKESTLAAQMAGSAGTQLSAITGKLGLGTPRAQSLPLVFRSHSKPPVASLPGWLAKRLSLPRPAREGLCLPPWERAFCWSASPPTEASKTSTSGIFPTALVSQQEADA